MVVVNWNRRDLLASCLKFLQRQTFRDFEVIVVDNGSTDGSFELLSAPEFHHVRGIGNSRNLGFCAANNQGIRAAQGAYVALLNNDAEPAPEWLQELLQAIETAPGIGMAASKILMAENHSVIDKAGHLIYLDGQNRGRGTGELDKGQYDQPEEVLWPDGCAAMYRKSMLDEIGGFDEDFFAYADDADLGLRARIAGWRCIYAPAAVVYHHVGSTLGRYAEKRLFLIERNRVWLVSKLFPWPMLLLSPFYFVARVAASAAAAALGRGELRQAADATGFFRLLKCLVEAQLAALAGLPAMLRKRRQLRAFRKLSAGETAKLLRRHRIRLRELVLRAR